MDGPKRFDRTGAEIPFEEWVGLYEDQRYRLVKNTDLPDGSHVFTVWLGVAPFDTPCEPRRLYVTAHCDEDHDRVSDEYTDTEASALECHDRFLAKLGYQ